MVGGLVGRTLALLALVLAATALARGSDAKFTSQSANPANALRAGALAAPTGLAATPAGRDVSVAFTPAADALGTQVLFGRPASGASCAGVTLAAAGSPATASPVAHTPSTAPPGTYACYSARSVRRSWTSLTDPAPVAVRVGVVVTSVVATAAASTSGCAAGSWQAGRLDCGDRFVVTFNQPIDTATGPTSTARVCAHPSYGVRLGAPSTTTDCSVPGQVGRIGGINVTGGFARYATTYTWNAARTQLTVDVRAVEAGSASTLTRTGSSVAFEPTTDTTKLQSATGAVHVCDTNAGGGDCRPPVTGSL